MARTKKYPPLLDRPKCKKCGRGIVKESFVKYVPGKKPVRLTVHRCLGYKNCPLVILEKEVLDEKKYVY